MSTSNDQWKQTLENSSIPDNLKNSLSAFIKSIHRAEEAQIHSLFCQYIKLAEAECSSPKQFPYYHHRERDPIDYYHLGLNLVRPMIDFSRSHVLGKENLKAIIDAIHNSENVVLFSNHQSEIDPQLISLLIEETSPRLAEEMIFVAGHRVVQDPLAIPFSRGRNLLCIYSKRYIEHPPESRTEKLQHNSRTLSALEDLLHLGGRCIYVAPSGGRDRKNQEGELEVAAFDPSSLELFLLLGQKARKKTRFFPLSLYSYDLLPPPEGIRVELGEDRIAGFAPAGLYFGDEIFPKELSNLEDKKEARKERAEKIHQIVVNNYKKILEVCQH